MALLALVVVLWVGGCSTAPSPQADGVASGPVVTPPPDGVTSGPVAPERVAVTGSASSEQVEAYAVMAQTALDRVEDLWGQGTVRWQVRVLLPATAADFADLTGGAPGSEAAPAVTVGSLEEAHIVVHPDAWDRLTPQGRQAVLTHEVTHLAQQGHGPVPSWLGEGLAELTAHRQSPLPPTAIAGSALDDVRAGQLPSTWPDPAPRTTDPREPTGADTAWGGYALSWLACLFVAQTWSEEALLELYAAVAGGAALHDAFPAVLGVSEAEALVGWRDWLRELVG